MEIGPDKRMESVAGPRSQPVREDEQEPAINILDQIIKGDIPDSESRKRVKAPLTPESIPAPENTSAEKGKGEAGPAESAGDGISLPNGTLTGSVAAASLPPSVGIPLLAELQKLSEENVIFYKERRFYIPRLMDKLKKIKPEKAEKILLKTSEKKRSRLKAGVDGGTPVRLHEEARVNELMAFKGLADRSFLSNAPLADLLKGAEGRGLSVKSADNEVKGAFAAYRSLIDPPGEKEAAPVQIESRGVKIFSISKENLNDIPRLQKSLKDFEYSYGELKNELLSREAIEPVENVSLKERIDAIRGIYSMIPYSEKASRDYAAIRGLPLDARGFLKTCFHYADILQTLNENARNRLDNETRLGCIKMIARRGKDHTDEIKVLKDLMLGGMDPASAIRIHELLPEPAKDGDYKNVAEEFRENGSWDTERVELVMKPPSDAPVSQKIALLRGIERHVRLRESYGYERNEAWNEIVKEYEHLRGSASDGETFTRLSRLYIEMLDAYNGDNWTGDYGIGLDFIAKYLLDKPGEFSAFTGLLKSGVPMSGAIKLRELLKEPVNSGDYENAGASINGDGWWNDAHVKLAMEPVGTSTFADRVEILKGFRRHQWEKDALEDYQFLIQRTAQGKDFEKIGKLYVAALDARGLKCRNEEYVMALDFIDSRLKDHPAEFENFRSILSSGFSITTAKKIFDSLAKPVKEGDYEKASEELRKNGSWDPSRVELVMKPPLDAPLGEKIALLRCIERHVRLKSYHGYARDEAWNEIVKEYEHLRGSAKNGETFTKLSRLYVEMLDAYNKNDWMGDYGIGLDFIAKYLMDKPEEFKVFTELLKSGVPMTGAVKLRELLKEPVNQGDYEKAAASISGDEWWNDAHVALAMEPVGTSAFADRVEILKGLRGHEWENDAIEDYGKIGEIAKDRDFVKLAKAYLDILDANGRRSRSNDYGAALDFVSSRLYDHPDELGVFVTMLKEGLSIETVRKIFDSLPKPENQGDFEKAAEVFKGNREWTPERVGFVMNPLGSMPLGERVALLIGIERHITRKDSYGYHQREAWNEATSEYNNVKSVARDDAELANLGRLYVEMLDSYNQSYWSESYKQGLEFLADCLRKSPEDIDVFFELLKKKMDIHAAMKIREGLPQPEKAGDYAEASLCFTNDDFWRAEKVEAVMAPASGTNLRERVNIFRELYSLVRESSLEDYRKLIEHTRETGDLKRLCELYLKALRVSERPRHDGGVIDFLASKRKERPSEYTIYFDLAEAAKNPSLAVNAWNAIQKPVKEEDYGTRVRAARELVPFNFRPFYEMACRNIAEGETVEDSARLLAALVTVRDDLGLESYESILATLLKSKGQTKASQLVNLIKTKAFDLYRPESLFETVKLLSGQVRDESYSQREEILISNFNRAYREPRRMSEALKDYEVISSMLDPGEKLEDAATRFEMIDEALYPGHSPDSERERAPSVVREAFKFIADEMKKGSFGGEEIREVTSQFVQIIMMSANLDEAKSQLLSKYAPKGVIEDGDDMVNIKGIKLRKKKQKTKQK